MPFTRLQLKKILQLGTNPGVGLFQAIQQMQSDMSSKMAKLKEEIIKEVLKEIKEIDPQNAGFIDKIVNKTVSQLVKDTKGDQGIQGIQGLQGKVGAIGQSIEGKKGLQGITGVMGATGKEGQDGKDGNNGVDGKTPIKGVDYFTKQERDQFLSQIIPMIKIKPILEDIRSIKKMLEEQEKENKKLGSRQRTLHRGGISLAVDELLGTGDGATTTFDLVNVPYDASSMISLHVAGGPKFLAAGDYTRSNKTLTFAVAPPNGAKVIASYRF